MAIPVPNLDECWNIYLEMMRVNSEDEICGHEGPRDQVSKEVSLFFAMKSDYERKWYLADIEWERPTHCCREMLMIWRAMRLYPDDPKPVFTAASAGQPEGGKKQE